MAPRLRVKLYSHGVAPRGGINFGVASMGGINGLHQFRRGARMGIRGWRQVWASRSTVDTQAKGVALRGGDAVAFA